MVSMSEARVTRATRDLPANHMIRPGDVVDAAVTGALPAPALANAESLHGAYVRSAKRAGDTFAPGDAIGSPILPASTTLLSLGLSASQALGGLLTADMRLDVYGIAKAAGTASAPDRLVKDVRVVAVLKNPAATDGSIIVILELPQPPTPRRRTKLASSSRAPRTSASPSARDARPRRSDLRGTRRRRDLGTPDRMAAGS